MAGTGGVSGAFDGARLTRALRALSGRTGFLAFGDGLREVCLLCAREGVRVVANGHRLPRLDEWLALRNVGTAPGREVVARALAHGAPPRTALERGGLPPDAVERAIRGVVASVVLDGLFWRGAQCDASRSEPVFEEHLYQTGHELMNLPCDVSALLEEVDERTLEIENIRRSVPGTSVSVTTTSEESARGRLERSAGTFEGDALDAVLARPGIHGSSLLEALGCGEMALLGVLARFVAEGIVRVDPLPADPEGDRARYERMERRLRFAASEVVQHLAMASAATDLSGADASGAPSAPGDAEGAHRAAHHLTQAGWSLLGQGRATEALDLFTGALERADDVAAAAGKVEALAASARREEAARETPRLARGLLAVGLPGQARRAVEKALEAQEDSTLLRLLVEAHEELGERRQARELERSVILQLRHEGRDREAGNLERRLASRDAGGREQSAAAGRARSEPRARPSGSGGRLAAGVAALLLPLLAVSAWLVDQHLASRTAYAEHVEDLQGRLGSAEAVAAIQPAEAFPPGASSFGEAQQRAARARRLLTRLGEDAAEVARLRSVVRYGPQEDLDEVLSILREARTRARTSALRAPLAELIERLEAERDEVLRKVERLRGHLRSDSWDEAFALARELTAPGTPRLPEVLAGVRIRLRVASRPSGATVWWGGVRMGRTPCDVLLSLEGSEGLRLAAEGHRALETEVSLSELEAPRLTFELQPAREEPQ